jgi:replicative DNA helicase
VTEPHRESTQAGAGSQGFRFKPRDSATFAREHHPLNWLVPQVLVAGQPAVVGGPKKAMKTSLTLDLAVSLGSGTPFLGYFKVPRKVRVAVLSGESGAATIQETAQRICKAKNIRLEDCDVLWQPDGLPCLSDLEDRERLRQGLAGAGVGVAVIDPLYLCLLGGGERAAASNLYEVGPLLLRAASACLDAGSTPLLVHHATKAAVKKADGEPLDLDDLAFAGVGEFARQWLLVSRRRPYQPGTGSHALTLAVGGSAGHSAVWHLDIEEGAGSGGRRWGVRVASPQSAAPEEFAPAKPAPGQGRRPRPSSGWTRAKTVTEHALGDSGGPMDPR